MQQISAGDVAGSAGIDAAVREFLDRRFGLFVHWGPGAGVGKPGKLAATDHAARVRGFEAGAQGFDAQHFVAAADAAAARYVTFVPKHAYDFCLWPTRVTDSHTRRDFLGELADACRAKGLPLFLYMNLNAAGYVELAKRNFADAETAMDKHHAIMTAWLEELVAYGPAGI
ncbi:MAG: alpha-L-fucosidase, partial [Phycisphaeraceae bacterium]